MKIVDSIRDEIRSGRVKTPAEIRSKLKSSIISVLQPPGKTSELQLGSKQTGVIFVVGVNGGGKTTTIGKLAHKFRQQDAKVREPNFPSLLRWFPSFWRCLHHSGEEIVLNHNGQLHCLKPVCIDWENCTLLGRECLGDGDLTAGASFFESVDALIKKWSPWELIDMS